MNAYIDSHHADDPCHRDRDGHQQTVHQPPQNQQNQSARVLIISTSDNV